ncbi:MAG TPA: hypothetical protein VGE89_16930 [Bryobacteraceae bacterium]|jgi:hypothetical protein
MAQTLLVGPEIETGRKILRALDDAKLKVSVAMWSVLSSYGDWRLVLSSSRLDSKGTQGAYHAVFEALDKAGFTIRDTESLVIFSMKDKFIRELRQVFAKAASVEGMRLGGQTFGDRHIEDAYVYRIS